MFVARMITFFALPITRVCKSFTRQNKKKVMMIREKIRPTIPPATSPIPEKAPRVEEGGFSGKLPV